MNCPVCSLELVMSERQGVEIDYCPKCRGVWLDRGELDKIIERSTSHSGGERREKHDKREYEHRHHDDRGHGKHKKRESFLSDLFDF